MFTPSIKRGSGDFLERMQERIAKWSPVTKVAVRLRVSDAAKWWVYHEYGTAVALGKGTYDIDPVKGTMLRFPDGSFRSRAAARTRTPAPSGWRNT